jgi:hypothetical protein
MNFKDLKKQKESNFEKLTKAVGSLNKGSESNGKDASFWEPTVDKMGNGYAVIRFLPAPKGEDLPFVRIWDHGFQGPGGWYIEKSLTTIGKQDPVSEFNSKLWNSSTSDDSPERKQARKQKRRLSYVSNIYVVSDPGNKENEGKVFRYKYGKKIFEKINDMMHPVHPDEEAMNPFDFWEGANFKLKIRQVDGYRNYDKSEFDKTGPLADDAELEEIWGKEHPLNSLVAESEFKTYDQLKARLSLVLGDVARRSNDEEAAPAPKQRASAPPSQKAVAPSKKPAADDDEEDTMEFFKRIAEEDE